MVSRLSRASTDPGNINEHAPNTLSTSTTVTSALHAAHPKQATIARGGQPHRQLSDKGTDIQNKGLDGDRGSSPGGHVHNTIVHPAQTSEYCHTEEEGREGPDKYIDTELP